MRTKTEILNNIVEEINAAQNISIMGHKRVDGDSAGAAFALYSTLEKLGKNPTIISEKGDETLPFFVGLLNPNYSASPIKTDLLILVDMGAVKTASVIEAVDEARNNQTKIILIDHHFSGDTKTIADLSLVDVKASSACEVLYDLITALGVGIDKNIATFIYTGIVSDSASFQYDSTSEKTFKIGSEMIGKGARKDKIVEDIFYRHSFETLKVLGLVIDRLFFNPKYSAAVTYIKKEEFPILKKNKISVSGIASFLNLIKDTKVIVVFAEEEPGKIKVSLRSNNEKADLTKIAEIFGGGGHIKASAFSIDGSIVETEDGIKVV